MKLYMKSAIGIKGSVIFWKLLPLTLASIICITAFSTACRVDNSLEIKNTITAFYNAFQNKEYSHCLEFISESQRATKGDRDIIDIIQGGRVFFVQLKSIGEPKISGNSAIIWIDAEFLNGMVLSQEISLIKEGNSWKIDIEKWASEYD